MLVSRFFFFRILFLKFEVSVCHPPPEASVVISTRYMIECEGAEEKEEEESHAIVKLSAVLSTKNGGGGFLFGGSGGMKESIVDLKFELQSPPSVSFYTEKEEEGQRKKGERRKIKRK